MQQFSLSFSREITSLSQHIELRKILSHLQGEWFIHQTSVSLKSILDLGFSLTKILAGSDQSLLIRVYYGVHGSLSHLSVYFSSWRLVKVLNAQWDAETKKSWSSMGASATGSCMGVSCAHWFGGYKRVTPWTAVDSKLNLTILYIAIQYCPKHIILQCSR